MFTDSDESVKWLKPGRYRYDYFGLSTDTKPTDRANGSSFIEMDTGHIFLFDRSSNTWLQWPSSGGGDADISQFAAHTYSPSSTYSAGDFVVYNNLLYKALVDISTAEAWTPAHWERVWITDEMGGDGDPPVTTNLTLYKTLWQPNPSMPGQYIQSVSNAIFVKQGYVYYSFPTAIAMKEIWSKAGIYTGYDGTTGFAAFYAKNIPEGNIDFDIVRTRLSDPTVTSKMYSYGSIGGDKATFVAVYNETTYDEIEKAVNEGKNVICYSEDGTVLCRLAEKGVVNISGTNRNVYYFAGPRFSDCVVLYLIVIQMPSGYPAFWTSDNSHRYVSIYEDIELLSMNWTGTGPWRQEIETVNPISVHTQMDLTATNDVIDLLVSDGVDQISIINEDGTAYAQALGAKPAHDLTVRVTMKEVISYD